MVIFNLKTVILIFAIQSCRYFFTQSGVECGEKKTVKEKYKDDTCTFMKYHEETVGHSSYSHTLPVDG